jgi:cold shock CspA family protein
MDTSERLTGNVKWFNKKAGFGFLTVCNEGEYKNKDIFVHYSAIRVTNSQYKYLIQGEYVNFNLLKMKNEKYEFQASDISGVLNGQIMCETKHQNNQDGRKLSDILNY